MYCIFFSNKIQSRLCEKWINKQIMQQTLENQKSLIVGCKNANKGHAMKTEEP